MPSGGDDDEVETTQQTWRPGPEDLLARNTELAQDPEMAGKRFAIPAMRKTAPVSAYLAKLLPSVDGMSMEAVPPPYVVVFNAVLQSFCAERSHRIIPDKVCRMWLLLLTEALVTEEFGMEIFPKAKPNRIFTVVGHFARVSVLIYCLMCN